MMLCDKPEEVFELRIAVQSAIFDLPEKQRAVMDCVMDQLEAGEDINIREISNRLRRPYTTLYEQFARAMLLLRKQLQYHPVIEEWLESKPVRNSNILALC